MLKVITVTNNLERTQPLIRSLEKFNWPSQVLLVDWKGFGTKLITLYEYLVANPDVDRFIFVDAHDVLVLGTPEEFEEKLTNKDQILFNAERGCWPPPVQQFEHLYAKNKGGWDYLNSGVYYGQSDLYIKIFEATPPRFETDDQWIWSMIYLFGNHPVSLDNGCEVFQCYSFIQPDDYEYANGRLNNLKTRTTPIFIHGNGAGDMSKVKELVFGKEEIKPIGIRV